MATYSSILVWRILWTEEPGGGTVHRVAKSRTRLKQLSTRTLPSQVPSNKPTMATQAASVRDSRGSLINSAQFQGAVFTKLGMGGDEARAAPRYPELRKGPV